MERLITLLLFLPVFSGMSQAPLHRERGAAVARVLTAASVNRATTARVGPGSSGPAVLRASILLDRAHFSCGLIDGRYSRNL